MTRLTLLLVAVAAGCSAPQPPAEVPVPVAAVEPRAQVPGGLKPLAPEAAKQIHAQGEPFRFAADAGGKKVEQSLTPKLPAEKLPRATQRPRASELERGELPAKKPSVPAAPLPLTARKTPPPPPPREGVPATVGVGSEMPLNAVKLPEGPRVKAAPRPEPTAADVPKMGTQQPDRVPVDDPTAEISTARIVNTLMLAPAMAAPYLRLLLPDPFEFAEHLKTPPVPEFATAPVFVPPARP